MSNVPTHQELPTQPISSDASCALCGAPGPQPYRDFSTEEYLPGSRKSTTYTYVIPMCDACNKKSELMFILPLAGYGLVFASIGLGLLGTGNIAFGLAIAGAITLAIHYFISGLLRRKIDSWIEKNRRGR